MAKKLDAAEFNRRAEIIRRLTAEGVTRSSIARAAGMSPSSLCQFFNRYLNVDGTLRTGQGQMEPVTTYTVDDLTEEQLRFCHRAGITPKRAAELLSCPRGGTASGWRGGAAIG